MLLSKVVELEYIDLIICWCDEVDEVEVRAENDEVDEMYVIENIILWVKTYQYVYDDDETDDVIIMVEIDANLRYD